MVVSRLRGKDAEKTESLLNFNLLNSIGGLFDYEWDIFRVLRRFLKVREADTFDSVGYHPTTSPQT